MTLHVNTTRQKLYYDLSRTVDYDIFLFFIRLMHLDDNDVQVTCTALNVKPLSSDGYAGIAGRAVSRAMQSLLRLHVGYYNYCYERTGALWGGDNTVRRSSLTNGIGLRACAMSR